MGTETEEFLAHYGVLGQKWGVRNAPKKGVRGKAPGTRNYDAKKLNNNDLKKVTNRMRLEQDYARLNAQNTSFGKKFTKDILSQHGKGLLNDVVRLKRTEFAAALVGGGAVIGIKKLMKR